jgi:two-component sensor histidine kinase
MLDMKLFEQLNEVSPQATLVLDEFGVIKYFNSASREMLKIPTDYKFEHLISSDPLPVIVRESTGALLAADKGAEILQLNKRTGGSFTASVSRHNILHNQTVVFMRDITDNLRYWEKLHQQKSIEDTLANSKAIREGKFDEAMLEIVRASSTNLKTGRVNVWLFDEAFNSLRTIINFVRDPEQILPPLVLRRVDLPHYFSLLEGNEIILTTDSTNDPQTAEIAQSYILPTGIKSMMDVPIRIEGLVVGLICFEDLDVMRIWDVSEQKFALSIAQIIAQTLETHRRQQAQLKLEQTLDEKQLLLREVNHRVKNNFGLISDILKVFADKAATDEQRQFISSLQLRLTSISSIHRQLYQSENIQQINLRNFLLDLTAQVRATFSSSNISINTLLDNVVLPMGNAIMAALIANELLSNACKHAFGQQADSQVTLSLVNRGSRIVLAVEDNGLSDPSTFSEEQTGLRLVRELTQKLKGELVVETTRGYKVSLSFAN